MAKLLPTYHGMTVVVRNSDLAGHSPGCEESGWDHAGVVYCGANAMWFIEAQKGPGMVIATPWPFVCLERSAIAMAFRIVPEDRMPAFAEAMLGYLRDDYGPLAKNCATYVGRAYSAVMGGGWRWARRPNDIAAAMDGEKYWEFDRRAEWVEHPVREADWCRGHTTNKEIVRGR